MAHLPMDKEVRIGLRALVVWDDMRAVLDRMTKNLRAGRVRTVGTEEDVMELTKLCQEHLRLCGEVKLNEARKN